MAGVKRRNKAVKASPASSRADSTSKEAHVDADAIKRLLKDKVAERRSGVRTIGFEVTATMRYCSPQGDGESVPATPPAELREEDAVKATRSAASKESNNPFVFHLSVDVMAVVLFALSLASRMIWLDSPRNVVFDEMHYAKYAVMYLKRTFFFDSNPPLGKLMVAGAAWLAGYQPESDVRTSALTLARSLM